MEITIDDLLSRFPWYGGLSEEYLNAVLLSAINSYNPSLIRFKDIVLLHAANTIQIEQSGMLNDVYFAQEMRTKQNTAYLKQQLDDLLEKENVGLLWIN